MSRPPPRRFETLGPAEVLGLAVGIERANARRFRAFASTFRGYDEAVARRFEELAAEEEAHERVLAEAFGRHFGGPIPVVDESDVDVVVESHDLDDAEHQIFDDFRPVRCYELALRAERAARAFYRRAAAAAADPFLQKLYEDLAAFEADHEAWCEARIRAERGPG